MKPTETNPKLFSRFASYLKDYKFAFFIAILGMIGYASIDAWVFSQLQPIIDDSFGAKNYDSLRVIAYFVVPVFILRGCFNFMGTYTLSWIGNKVVMSMRQQLFDKYIYLPVSYHDNHAAGQLISKIIFDTEQVSAAASKALLILVREGAFVIGLLVVMFYYSWQLSLIFLLIGPVVAIIVGVVSKRFRSISRNIQHAMGNLTSSVEQVIKGHKVVLMFGGQDKEKATFQTKNNHNRQQNMKLIVARILSVSSIQVIASIALAFVLYVSSFPGMVDELTPGIFTTVVASMIVLLKPLKQLTTVNSEFQKGMAACQSIFDVLDQLEEVDAGNKTLERSDGNIQFEEVTFSYPNAHTYALQNVSFNANAGQSIALVGRSGSGKSTISSLLTRFYNPQKGRILIDGEALHDITLTSLRKQFALVSQHVTLFNDTIANNIAYGSQGVSHAQIEHAAKMAHVDEFVQGFEHGYQTLVGENGANLSGGQRQRIAIARAILLDAPILILDEATSALDTESERYIQEALDTLQQGRTSIVVAHRLSTIENADCILVIDQGQIIEQGTHEDLLEKGGAYKQLHALQFREGTSE